MPVLETVDWVLLASMVPLLALSGLFSASETVLFGLTVDDRNTIRRHGGVFSAAIESLLRQPRLLLISILLCNMTINTVYMTIGSLLLLRHGDTPLAGLLFGFGTLALIIVFGEVVPKMAGQTHRKAAARIIAAPVAVVHRFLLPLDRAVSHLIVEPLHRLLGPSPGTHLDPEELDALVDLSVRQGAIDRDEETLLKEVLSLRSLRVKDIMTPRVAIRSVAVNDDPLEIRREIEETHLRRLPVRDDDLDHVVGILPCRRFLLAHRFDEADCRDIRSLCRPASFVPEVASVEQLLARFREEGATIAIVVDEFGGTSGLVTIEDVAEELVGEIADVDDPEVPAPERLGDARWRVSGLMALHDWRDVFRPAVEDHRASTVGGLFLAELGRLARPGDEIRIANVRLVAERVDAGRVASAVVDLVDQDA